MSSASCESCLRSFLGCVSMFVEDGCVRVACILINRAVQPLPGSWGQERKENCGSNLRSACPVRVLASPPKVVVRKLKAVRRAQLVSVHACSAFCLF